MYGIIPYMRVYWADPVVHLLLLKSSILGSWHVEIINFSLQRFANKDQLKTTYLYLFQMLRPFGLKLWNIEQQLQLQQQQQTQQPQQQPQQQQQRVGGNSSPDIHSYLRSLIFLKSITYYINWIFFIYYLHHFTLFVFIDYITALMFG